MLLGDVNFADRDFLLIVGGIVSSTVGGIVFIFRLLVSRYDKQLEELKADRDGYKLLALGSVQALEKKMELVRQERGERPPAVVPPVEPRHHSPVTEAQRDTANLETLQARSRAAMIALGLPDPTPELPTVVIEPAPEPPPPPPPEQHLPGVPP